MMPPQQPPPGGAPPAAPSAPGAPGAAPAAPPPRQKPASMARYKRELRREINRKHKEPEIDFLNITAMLDMMTIILVFLLKSMSQSSASLPQSGDLTMPKSVLTTEASQDGVAVLPHVAPSTAIGQHHGGPVIRPEPAQDRRGGALTRVNPGESDRQHEVIRQRHQPVRLGPDRPFDVGDHRQPQCPRSRDDPKRVCRIGVDQ